MQFSDAYRKLLRVIGALVSLSFQWQKIVVEALRMAYARSSIFVVIVLLSSLAVPVAADTFEDALAAKEKGDYATALVLFRSLANQGLADAQFMLGNCYTLGEGVPKNDAEAVKWHRLAANQGLAKAQLMLGLQYASGTGVPKNYVRAYIWFSLSAAQGNQAAARYLEKVSAQMTYGQIAESQKLAAEWRPRTANASTPEMVPPYPSPKKPAMAATSGTAFLVSNNGVALTNAHVVKDCQRIDVNRGAARLLARDGKNDLALLATEMRPAQQPNWSVSVQQGEDVVVYGFPLAGMLSSGGNVVTGNVTALAGLGDDSRYLQISAPVQPGNSGGPLFDRNGNVVGIVVSKLNAINIASSTGDIPQNVNFAIKASVAMAFLDSQHITHLEGVQPGRDNTGLSTPEITKRAQALTLSVVCVH